MVAGWAMALTLVMAVTGCSPTRPVLAVQESAIAFFAGQAKTPICVHVATKAGELVEGMVRNDLADPPQGMVRRLGDRGLVVLPFSTCEREKHWPVELAVGWPSAISDGFEVPVDRLCGPLGCDRGYRVHVVKTAEGWRAVGARTTWVS
jgi:hypothetical protein